MPERSLVYVRRPVRDRLRALLASDSVRNLIWVYYFWFLAWSVYGTFYAYPIRLIVEPMGQLVYNIWVWTPLVATPVALGGLAIRHGGSPAAEIRGPLLRADFLGLWMQVGGHACMAVVIGVFIGTGIMGAEPHQPIPSVFWMAAYFMGCCFLAAQCVYKLRLGRRGR